MTSEMLKGNSALLFYRERVNTLKPEREHHLRAATQPVRSGQGSGQERQLRLMGRKPSKPSSFHHLPEPSCCRCCSAAGGTLPPGLRLGGGGSQAPAKTHKLRAGSRASEETAQGKLRQGGYRPASRRMASGAQTP